MEIGPVLREVPELPVITLTETREVVEEDIVEEYYCPFFLSSRSGLGSLVLMLKLLLRRVCRGRDCRWGGLGIMAAKSPVGFL
ncbi:hypothetical protein BHE74_00022298 [Ensete ventricosum]|nr:hypothetical protein BHE74_00022298 [Ensete ventricosum]